MIKHIATALACLLCSAGVCHAGSLRDTGALNGFFPTAVWFFAEDDASYINRHIDDAAKARQYYERVLKDLASNGVNLIIANWTPADHRQMLLDIAQKNGIKVVVHLDEINSIIGGKDPVDSPANEAAIRKAVAPIANHRALAGYYLIDEPSNSTEMAARIAAARKMLERLDPRHIGMSCLLGGYESLLQTVDYPVLLIDIYPIGMAWNGDFSGYISELRRGQKNASNRPLWVIPQAFGKPNAWKIPTPEEIRAQVWQALACGAKGIVYFIYQSTTEHQGEHLQGLVDMDLNPMDGRLAEISRINSDIRKLAPLLLRLTADSATVDLPDSVVGSSFTDTDGTRYIIVANKRADRSVYVKWANGPATDVLSGVRVTSGLSLAPGSGRVLKMD